MGLLQDSFPNHLSHLAPDFERQQVQAGSQREDLTLTLHLSRMLLMGREFGAGTMRKYDFKPL